MPDIIKEATRLSVKAVAKRYRVKERQVLYAVRRGLVVAHKDEGGWSWYFFDTELPDKWPVRKQKFRTKMKRAVNE